MSEEITSAYSGPSGGVSDFDLYENYLSLIMKHDETFAYGISMSLYEKAPEDLNKTRPSSCSPCSSPTKTKPLLIGDPVADVFGIIARKNNGI